MSDRERDWAFDHFPCSYLGPLYVRVFKVFKVPLLITATDSEQMRPTGLVELAAGRIKALFSPLCSEDSVFSVNFPDF